MFENKSAGKGAGYPGADSMAPVLKLAGVKIVGPLNVMGAPTQIGTLNLIIIAMGDDGRVYRWDGKLMEWVVQR